MELEKMTNIDKNTVESFGAEWARFDQNALGQDEHKMLFDFYFHIFPWQELPEDAEGFDMGCGSGRWAALAAPNVGTLHCIDPALEALDVACRKMEHLENVVFHHAGVSDAALPEESQDFGYSLGVLHHIPDTLSAMRSCTKMLKPGAPFLVYLYYRFDNRPFWYAAVWKISDVVRRFIRKLPDAPKNLLTDIIASIVYWPLARTSLLAEKLNFNVTGWLLSSYRNTSFYTMRTDSRDRFGTPLEQRFTRVEIEEMMHDSGLENVEFSDDFPFWCAVGRKKPQ
jgi:ubiquinone/menaquinone biosynthesis C-methylase UbiE